ncbi:hypothetical protein ACHAWF_000678 [Thalassiosira exigua]
MSANEANDPSAVADPRFRGKVVVVTGAGGNFGRAGCAYFARRGASVAAVDVDAAALKQTVDEVSAAECPGKVRGYTCDVTDVASVDAAVEDIARDHGGRVDMLWNNAGYQGQIKPTLEYDPADFARVMDVNVTGMFVVLQRVAQRMADARAKGGEEGAGPSSSHPFSIVNTASVAALRGTPAMVAYASSKAAVLAMTVSTAKVGTVVRASAKTAATAF